MSTLTSVTVSPANPFILTTQTSQFVATAHFSDAADLVVTTDPTTAWVSSVTSVATIVTSGGSKGLATALTISGSTIISATYGGQTGTAILRVGLANYTRIFENIVDGIKIGESSLNAAHNPIAKLTVANFSLVSGGCTLTNFNGTSGGTTIGWTLASGHPNDFARLYISHEQQTIGDWVQLNVDSSASNNLSSSQRNLGVVNSIAVNSSGNQIITSGTPVLVQLAGEEYVNTLDNTINQGDFLGPDLANNGCVIKIAFNPSSPTPILGYALENFSATYQNKVLMRIQICGD